MITIYKLEAHNQINNKNDEFVTDDYLIGFFSSVVKCDEVKKDYSMLPGFSLPTCYFSCISFSFNLSLDRFPKYVYYISDVTIIDDETMDDICTEIGLALNEEEAKAKKTSYINERYQNVLPEESTIYIDKYRIDQRYWTEGFIIE